MSAMSAPGSTAFPYVDAHVHFWDPAVLSYPWLAEYPAIAPEHGPRRLRAELGDALPEALVFVQAECDRAQFAEEVDWVMGLARAEPRIGAIVAFAPMDQGERTETILADLGRRSLVRGIRHPIQDDPDPDLCRRPAFTAGVRKTGQKGWVFEICVRARQLAAALDLVKACPDTRFVLDHAGKPDIGGGGLDPWRDHIGALAAEPNVTCKLSGLVTEGRRTSSMHDDLRPYVDHVLGTFGPERVLFGSDWPVLKLASSARVWLDTAHALVEHLAPDARRAIFSDNARRIYALP